MQGEKGLQRLLLPLLASGEKIALGNGPTNKFGDGQSFPFRQLLKALVFSVPSEFELA
jgi:hypothetical protein